MDRKIIDYTVVEGNILHITDEVKKKINDGRCPIGGISRVIVEYTSWYTQAMIKYEPLPSTQE